jgi:hypothetical protein
MVSFNAFIPYFATRLIRRVRGAQRRESISNRYELTEYLLSRPRGECIQALEAMLRTAWEHDPDGLDGSIIQRGLDALSEYQAARGARVAARDARAGLRAQLSHTTDADAYMFYCAVGWALDVAFPSFDHAASPSGKVYTVVTCAMGRAELPEDKVLELIMPAAPPGII